MDTLCLQALVQRKRSKAKNKVAVLPIRLTPDQKEALVAAARREGLGVSSWLRQLGLRAAGWEPEDGR